MKFKRAIWINFAVPGTVIEIKAFIVRNDMSFRRPKIYWIIKEIRRFPAIAPGTVEEKTSTPPLNLAAIDTEIESTYGGTGAYFILSYGIKQKKSSDLN